jgi:hypothetical protein
VWPGIGCGFSLHIPNDGWWYACFIPFTADIL